MITIFTKMSFNFSRLFNELFFKQLNLKKDNFWNYQIVIMWRFLNHNLKLQPEFYDFFNQIGIL